MADRLDEMREKLAARGCYNLGIHPEAPVLGTKDAVWLFSEIDRLRGERERLREALTDLVNAVEYGPGDSPPEDSFDAYDRARRALEDSRA